MWASKERSNDPDYWRTTVFSAESTLLEGKIAFFWGNSFMRTMLLSELTIICLFDFLLSFFWSNLEERVFFLLSFFCSELSELFFSDFSPFSDYPLVVSIGDVSTKVTGSSSWTTTLSFSEGRGVVTSWGVASVWDVVWLRGAVDYGIGWGEEGSTIGSGVITGSVAKVTGARMMAEEAW